MRGGYGEVIFISSFVAENIGGSNEVYDHKLDWYFLNCNVVPVSLTICL
jgi:hypothetical protein